MTEELKQKAEEWVAKYVGQSVEVVRKVALRFYKHLQTAYIAGATEATKELQEEIETLKHNKKTVAHLSSCVSDVQKKQIERAKELLKKFMKISEENGRQFDEEVYFEAREFLKE